MPKTKTREIKCAQCGKILSVTATAPRRQIGKILEEELNKHGWQRLKLTFCPDHKMPL